MRYRLIGGGLSDETTAAVLKVLREHNADVARESAREIAAQVPEYARPHDPRYHETLVLMCEWSNAQFLDLIEDDEAPVEEMLAFFREIGEGEALEGRPPELWETGFRIGTGVAFRRFTEIAMTVPGITPAVIGRVAEKVLGFQNTIMVALHEGHAKAGPEGRRKELRRRLVDLLLGPDPEQEAVHDLAVRVGWPVPATAAVVTLRRRDPDSPLPPRVPTDALSGLHLPEPCLIVPDPDGPGRRASLTRALADWTAALGPTRPITALADSHRWAGRALSLVARGLIPADTPVIALDHVPLLLIAEEPALLAELAASRLAPLESVRPRQRDTLARTLLALLETGFQPQEAAARLTVHHQTVRYRIRTIDSLFGPEIRDPDHRLEYHLALHHHLMTERPDQ
ncbi:helix-turn-helix domain-containing protein [Actinocorallia sp. API 0066]|uniref:helix-turn-helix domain-containing protein n=1 Tax=Actinocorallia sp. API 0066 TaxID=2896846 RepID=UPI001E4ECB5E|nr:helix-turn-helix domain-containing protein [Actinocorallia sp. API 0066]MCD0448526.1 helix-turn-helix domain-containing protein [Actinocorallia sp. API 0066]